MAEGKNPSSKKQQKKRQVRVKRVSNAGEHESALSSPLRIAVVGVTSSGKTTLINGLLGHRVLPSDADELSAGLTAFHPSLGASELLVGKAPGWNAGRYWLREEGDLERRLRSILFLAQYEGSRGTLEAPPRLEIRFPLAFCGHLLGLHEGYPLELMDAPGLRVRGDTKNLGDILESLKNSLVLLVLDASRTMNREEILEILALLKEHNEFTQQGIGPLLIFNKIDRINAEDRSVRASQEEMLQLCRNALGREVEILPLSGLIFQRATELRSLLMRWVSNAQEEERLRAALHSFLTAFHDVSGALRKLARPNRAERERLRAIEDAVTNDKFASREDLHWLAEYLGATSGGTQMLEAARRVVRQILDKRARRIRTRLPRKNIHTLRQAAEMLGLMVRADGIVHQEELALANDLLDDFSLKFFGQHASPGAHKYLDQISHGERSISSLPGGFLQKNQKYWMRNALRSLMAVDREVHEQEQRLLEKMKLD